MATTTVPILLLSDDPCRIIYTYKIALWQQPNMTPIQTTILQPNAFRKRRRRRKKLARYIFRLVRLTFMVGIQKHPYAQYVYDCARLFLASSSAAKYFVSHESQLRKMAECILFEDENRIFIA